MRTILVLFAIAFTSALSAQAPPVVPPPTPAKVEVSWQGGIWTGTNGKTSIVSLPAAKISRTFTMTPKWKLEFGLLLLPGFLSDDTFDGRRPEQIAHDGRLGLTAGGFAIIRINKWKLKPLVGVSLVKDASNVWQGVPGVGFVF